MLQQTITLVVIRNPFTLEREIMKVPYLAIQTAVGYTKHLGFEDELVYSVNGKLLEKPEESYLQPADYLVVCPVVGKGGGSKNPLQVIAGIALSVVTMGVGGLASGVGWGAAMSSWSVWGYLAATAVMYVGGQLLSSAFGWDTPDLSYDSTSNTTYSWNEPTINTKQGGAVPLTYGTVKVTNPMLLSQHITSDGKNQYYNLLLCGGEGPVSSISDIRINDNPITNYQDVVVETRLGTNDQTCMTNFADTFSDQNADYELDESYWSTLLLDGNNGQAIEVTLEAKGGLYTLDGRGNYQTANVVVQVQYKKKADLTWLEYGTYTMSGSTNTAVRNVYRLDGLEPAQYEVRMQVKSRSAAKTSTRSMVRVWWSMATLIVYDDFTRPGKVLVGIKALATSQLSGSLSSVTWLQTRDYVYVWNPSTSQYEQKPATNPAWACYDMLHLCKRLKDTRTGKYGYYSYGADKDLFVWQRFKDWADYCATYNLTVNILVNAIKKLFSSLEQIEACGRGKVIMQGTKFSCICDAPAVPVQMFGMGNIYMDSFREDFLGLDDRANSVEVTYNNKDKNYQRDSFIAYADDYDTSNAVDNPTQITLNGKTSYEEAYREAKYKLRCNKYLIRTCSFDVDVDAIACQVGDVILLSHDVPRWGTSGRILRATANTITLPYAVELTSGKSYGIYVRLDDDTLVYKAVQGVMVNSTTDTLIVSTPFNVIPETDNVFTFGEIGKEAKPFRVASITRSQELRRKVSCLEYIEAVYEETENVPAIQYSQIDNTVKIRSVAERMDIAGKLSLLVGIDIPRRYYSGSVVMLDGIKVATTDVTQTAVEIPVTEAKTYTISVAPVNVFGGQGEIMSTTYTVTGSAPDAVAEYIVYQNLRQLEHYWVVADDAYGVEIRKLDPNNLSWERGTVINTGIAGNKFIDTSIVTGTSIFGIKAIGKNGIYSATMKTATVTVNTIPASNIIVALDEFTSLDGTCTGCEIDGAVIKLSVAETWDENTESVWSESDTSIWGSPLVTSGTYTTQIKDVGKILTSIVNIKEFKYSGTGDVWWRYGNTIDEILSKNYQPFIGGQSNTFRYHQWDIRMLGDGSTQELTAFSIAVDVPDIVLKYPNENTPSIAIMDAEKGVKITFPEPFVKTPTITGSVVPGPGYVVPVIVTPSYCLLKATSNGTDSIAGDLHVQIIGY